ncbi:MAG: DEAD/DEAH box helicase family protein [Sulfuritalea sp.]|nr:DEAD/DEAH box helicase family protein [Sulfuritalea sp.]
MREGFRNGHKRQVLAAPTGSGKSVMMLDIIRSARRKARASCSFASGACLSSSSRNTLIQSV